MVRKYSKGSQNQVEKEMRKFKKGTAKSGKGGKAAVKNKEQAIAIGLSKARKKAEEVPTPTEATTTKAKPTTTTKKTTTKKSVTKKSSTKKTVAKKSPAKKATVKKSTTKKSPATKKAGRPAKKS